MLSYFYSFNVTAVALSQILTTTDKSVELKSDCFIYFCFVKGWEQVHLLHVPPRDDGHEGRYEPPPNPQPQVQILKYMYSSTYMYMVWKKTKCSDRKLWQTDQQTDMRGRWEVTLPISMFLRHDHADLYCSVCDGKRPKLTARCWYWRKGKRLVRL